MDGGSHVVDSWRCWWSYWAAGAKGYSDEPYLAGYGGGAGGGGCSGDYYVGAGGGGGGRILPVLVEQVVTVMLYRRRWRFARIAGRSLGVATTITGGGGGGGWGA